MIFLILYIFFLSALDIFSWSFVGNNFPFLKDNPLFNFFQQNKLFGWLYIFFIIIYFIFYVFILYKVKLKKFGITKIINLLLVTMIILIISFPAFSYDIFNYIATAKVTYFYKENPYIVMPIEIANEPLLSFMHAPNKIALYGPTWILITLIPYIIGGNNILRTVFATKALIAASYLTASWLIWKLSNKNAYSVVFYAMNPLVVIETLISGHNDIVMMMFALFAFYFIRKNKSVATTISILISILIKYSTFFLTPIFFYLSYKRHQKKLIDWEAIWLWSAVAMYLIFFLSPLREEIYSWYLIWTIVFVALMPEHKFFQYITVAFSFGLLFRFAPFLFTLSWEGKTPLVKEVVTFFPLVCAILYYVFQKIRV